MLEFNLGTFHSDGVPGKIKKHKQSCDSLWLWLGLHDAAFSCVRDIKTRVYCRWCWPSG